MSPNPAKDLPLCWEQHTKLLPGLSDLSCSTVAKWSTEEVANFVKKLPGCGEHASKFADEVSPKRKIKTSSNSRLNPGKHKNLIEANLQAQVTGADEIVFWLVTLFC